MLRAVGTECNLLVLKVRLGNEMGFIYSVYIYGRSNLVQILYKYKHMYGIIHAKVLLKICSVLLYIVAFLVLKYFYFFIMIVYREIYCSGKILDFM